LIAIQDFDWDDDLIDATLRDGQTHARVCRPSQVAVVLGRGSRPKIEVDVEAVQRDRVPLLRRRGGGCSVVLDPGNVIVSCALPLPGFGGTSRAFGTISDWVINALDQTGVPAVHQSGISDLALGERKIGGACIYRTKGLLYYTTTLLFQPDVDLVERYLKHPPREPGYRAGRAHRAFMGALANRLPLHNNATFAAQMNQVLTSTVETLVDLNANLDGPHAHTTSRQEATA